MTRTRKRKKANTPYDDVFRTLLIDCPSLIIPVINEIFHENYASDEKVILHQNGNSSAGGCPVTQNEHFINMGNGEQQERITDARVQMQSRMDKEYHVECESKKSGGILVRLFEYDSQIALEQGVPENNILTVKFPKSAVLFLRSNEKTPNIMQMRIEMDEKIIYRNIPVMKMKDYSPKEIFEKHLYFLIPFYIFNHESKLEEYEHNHEKLEKIEGEYENIKKCYLET